MAKLKVFVSSTCYDLGVVRSQLRDFILSFGFEPIMSDYSDIPYDPRNHTHVSCINEVEHCDMLIVIIGSRFGGTALPKAREIVNLDTLKTISKGTKFLEEYEEMSITQLEVLRAIELGIPIFPFIQSDVQHDHNLYEKNKDKTGIIDQIDFPSIQKVGTAKYIFEFINFLRLRATNNGIESFSKLDEIQNYLRKQWSGLFQRLLYEQKINKVEEKGFEMLTSQMEDLKAALMTSIQSPELKSVARGAVKYRRLLEFLLLLSNQDKDTLLLEIDFSDLLNIIKIKDIVNPNEHDELSQFITNNNPENNRRRPRYLFIMEDGRVFGIGGNINFIMDEMLSNWNEFIKESKATKETLIETYHSDDKPKYSWIWNIEKLDFKQEQQDGKVKVDEMSTVSKNREK